MLLPNVWYISKKSSMKKILIVLFVISILGGGVAYYMYNKPKKDYTDVKIDLNISANELFQHYSTDEHRADSLYREKVLAVNGNISQTEKNQKQETVIYLSTDDPMFGIQFTMLLSDSDNYKALKSGDAVTIKGLCTGYTNDVVITNSTVVK